MNQGSPGGKTTQTKLAMAEGGTAPQDASDHATNGQNAVQQAVSFLAAVLSGDTQKVQDAVKNTETHLISLGLDFVPPTYRGVVQPIVDGFVNGNANANFITREVGIGVSIAQARLNAILGSFRL